MTYPSPLPTCPLYCVFHQSMNTIINCAAVRWIKKASTKFKRWEQSLQKFPFCLSLKTTLKYSKRPLNPSSLEHIPKAEFCGVSLSLCQGALWSQRSLCQPNLKEFLLSSFCVHYLVGSQETMSYMCNAPKSTRGAQESYLALLRCCWSNGNEVRCVEWGVSVRAHVSPSFSLNHFLSSYL